MSIYKLYQINKLRIKFTGIFYVSILILLGCVQNGDIQSSDPVNVNDLESFNDTLQSISKDSSKTKNSLQIRDEKSPIEVISATAVIDDNGIGKIIIKYKNITKTSIDAVQFNYLKFNAFGDPLGEKIYDQFSKSWRINNRGTVTVNQTILPNKMTTSSIDVYVEDKKFRKLTATPVKVSYKNGEVWKERSTAILEGLSGSYN